MKYTTTWATDPYMIGWESFFPKLETLAKTNATSFPPYNVRKIGDDKFVIELAVAGYNKSNLTLTEEDCCLTVTGELPETTDEYIHKGIAGRKFTRTFSLAEHMEVECADITDGILYVCVVKNIPEHKKPKTIEITSFEDGRKRK